jgi:hypothetical protein
VSPEIHQACSKPALNAESFQRLLSAAYILQSHSHHSDACPIAVADKKPFAAGAILQTRTSSLQPPLRRLVSLRWASAVPSFTGPMLWKTAEAFAIAAVFCLMMGMSIHHLLAYPGRASSSKILQTEEAAQLASAMPSPQTDATRKSRQSQDDVVEAGADINDGDLVIHYRPRIVNRSGSMANRTTTQDAGKVTARVVRYGDDVTMWSSASSEASLNRRKID